jgi:hypothetical protein
MEELVDLDNFQMEQRVNILSENIQMMEEEEIYLKQRCERASLGGCLTPCRSIFLYLKQRSHETWLLKGDGNNELFS